MFLGVRFTILIGSAATWAVPSNSVRVAILFGSERIWFDQLVIGCAQASPMFTWFPSDGA